MTDPPFFLDCKVSVIRSLRDSVIVNFFLIICAVQSFLNTMFVLKCKFVINIPKVDNLKRRGGVGYNHPVRSVCFANIG